MIVKMNGKTFDVAPEPADYWGWVSNGSGREHWEMMDRFLRPEHTFVDVGAWIGSYSLYAASITKRVIAFEPDPVAFEILEKNTAGCPIIAHNLAVTAHGGSVTLGSAVLGASTTRQNLSAGSSIGEATITFDAPSTTLRKLDLPDPLFIKMDVEGGEEELLQDFEFFEKRRPIVMLELHPFWWKDSEKMQETLLRLIPLYPNFVRADGLAGQKFNPLETWPREVVLA